jgi:hypothetical protein
MPDNLDAEFQGFCDKLEEFKGTLSPIQKGLLDAILKLAWDAAAKEEALERGFDGCFTPEDAATISAFSAGGLVIQPRMIKAHLIKPLTT